MARTKNWLLFVGPIKTGTSWVDRAMRSINGVCLPRHVKETHFFDRYFDRGTKWYFEQFPQEPSGLMVEVVPSYFFSKGVPERIRDTIPDARIVVSLRDPVQRAVSHYLQLRKYGFTDLNIEQALHRLPKITGHSIYAGRLDHWFRTFGKSKVQVIFYEEVVGNVARLVDEVLPGARLKPRKVAEPGRINAAAVPRSYTLARFGQRVTKALRNSDMHAVVNVGKLLGLKKALYAGGAMPERRELEAALNAWKPAFEEDREALIRLLGRCPPWFEKSDQPSEPEQEEAKGE